MCIYLPDPISDVVKTILTCAIISKNDALGSSIICLSYSSKPFLSCSVPYLYFNILAVEIDGPYLEVNSYMCFLCFDVKAVLTYGRNVWILEIFLAESQKKTGLTYSGITNNN